MKIVNIDALRELVRKVDLSFILDVIKPLEDKYYKLPARCQMEDSFSSDDLSKIILPNSPIRMFYYKVIGYENIATLIHTIPIYLRNKEPEKKDETGIIETLGAYYPIVPNNPKIKRDSPYIELFLTPISESTKGNDTHFKWLLTKVLLHELAHAAMDIYNIEENETEEKVFVLGFRKWREESMANAVALRIIRDYGEKDYYDYAKGYMRSQDPEYALGVLLEDFDHWDFRSIIDCKINGVDSVLQQEWLTYVLGNPTAEGLKEWNEKLISINITN